MLLHGRAANFLNTPRTPTRCHLPFIVSFPRRPIPSALCLSSAQFAQSHILIHHVSFPSIPSPIFLVRSPSGARPRCSQLAEIVLDSWLRAADGKHCSDVASTVIGEQPPTPRGNKGLLPPPSPSPPPLPLPPPPPPPPYLHRRQW